MMKAHIQILITNHSKHGLFVIQLLTLLITLHIITACSSSNSSSGFTPKNTLEGKVFVLGAQDIEGDLVLYVNGTNTAGAPLTITDMQTATLIVDGSPYTNADVNVEILQVHESDKFLALTLVTDWSNSTNGEIALVADIYKLMLTYLPRIYEAQVITFSDEHTIQQSWTEDIDFIKAGIDKIHNPRNKTALYDTMGYALEGDLGTTTDGLIERCRPAHMMVVFTDGDDNLSSVHSDNTLNAMVNADRTVSIILGTSDAKAESLQSLAGDYGAVVQVINTDSLAAEVNKWASSLKDIAKITLSSAIYTSGKAVSIKIGSQTVTVNANSHCTPE